MQINRRFFSALFAYAVLGATLLIFAIQLRSLYTTPVADSVRWGGDETWLMREFGNQIRHGVMQYPENYGEPPRTDGVLAGSMWVNALVYGGSGSIFFPRHDLASIGRTVTAMLGAILILSVWLLSRRLGVEPLLVSAMVLVLVTNRGFYWATHSARYDVMTGLALVWYVCAAATKIEKEWSSKEYFLLGASAVLVLLFSRHLLTLTAPVTLLALTNKRIWGDLRALAKIVAGALIAFLLLAAAYWAGAGELSFFGRGGAYGSYSFVLGQLPILRPFSRSVQVSNIQERLALFNSDAAGILYALTVVVLLFLSYKLWQFLMRRRGKELRLATLSSQRFVVLATLLSTLSWLLLQGTRPYYLLHIAPLLLIGSGVILQWLDEVLDSYRYGYLVGPIVLALGLMYQAATAVPRGPLGRFAQHDQRAALAIFDEATSRNGEKPRVLCDVAGLDQALCDTTITALTLDMFQPPADSAHCAQKLLRNRIDYVVLRSSPVGVPFEPGRAKLPDVLRAIGSVDTFATGFYYDDGRSYDATLDRLALQGLDTLRLYRVSRP